MGFLAGAAAAEGYELATRLGGPPAVKPGSTSFAGSAGCGTLLGTRRADSGALGTGGGGGGGGNGGGAVRARKQSWFQTEITEKIPLTVQQACADDWAARQCMPVVCAELGGTFYVSSSGEYLVKLDSNGELVTPNKFEELAGKKTARNWQQSIRLVGACAAACAPLVCSRGKVMPVSLVIAAHTAP
jgi:hypothetical protein